MHYKTRIRELRTKILEQKLLKEQMPVVDNNSGVLAQVHDSCYEKVTIYNTQKLDAAIKKVAINIVFDAQKITIAPEPEDVFDSANQRSKVYIISVEYPNMDKVDFCKLQITTFHDLYKGFIHTSNYTILSTHINDQTIRIYAPLEDRTHLTTYDDEPISANTVCDYVASKLKQLLVEYQKRQQTR